MRRLFIIFGIVALLLVVGASVVVYKARKESVPTTPSFNETLATLPADVKNVSVRIEESMVSLQGGKAESANAVTDMRGDVVFGDLNDDGVDDASFILTQETGGTGVFYYVATALKTEEGWLGTNAVFLGDRIAPEKVSVEYGLVQVFWKEHGAEQSFAEEPKEEKRAFFETYGATLSRVEVPEGSALVAGTLSQEEGVFRFAPCDGVGNVVATSSRARALVEATLVMRGGEGKGAFAVLALAPHSASTTPLSVVSVVRAPERGVCR
jgi:hypothetical protein